MLLVKGKIQSRKYLSGFTLVELIVVITILAILGTIGFISIQGYSSSSRDSVRISDMKNIELGLSLYNVKAGGYMDPESPVSIEASGTVIGLQGYFGDDLARNIGMSTTPLDPMDKNRYVYSVNATKTKYQMMGFLEGVQNVSLGKIDTAYAIDYSKKFPRTGGDTVGILLDSVTLAPVSGSKVDLKTINAATSYKAYFGNASSDIVTATGTVIFSNIYNRQAELIKNKSIAILDDSLVGYWDMETLTGGSLKDLSGKGNDGIGNNGVVIGGIDGNGKTGKATNFNGTSNYIDIGTGSNIQPTSAFTISLWFNAKSFNGVGSAWGNTLIGNYGGNNKGYQIMPERTPNSSTNMKFTLGQGSSQTSVWTDLTYANQWNHIIGIWDGTKITVYLNGKKGNSADVASASYDSTFGVGIGKAAWGSDFFSGSIDEVRIYNRALSDSEIQTLYHTI